MAFLVFAIFSFVWYYPAYKKQGNVDRLPGKAYRRAILFGIFPATILLLSAQLLLTYVRKLLPLGTVAHNLWEAFLSAAAVEEGVKFLFAWLVIRKFEPKRKIDYALIFAAVGMGYQIAESLMMMDGVVTALIRGIFAYHVLWQYWMGLYFFDYRQAKARGDEGAARKALLLSVGVPFLLHGLNDFIAFMNGAAVEGGIETEIGAWVFAFLLFVIASIVYLIITMKKVFRAAKESRELVAEEAVPEEDVPEAL